MTGRQASDSIVNNQEEHEVLVLVRCYASRSRRIAFNEAVFAVGWLGVQKVVDQPDWAK